MALPKPGFVNSLAYRPVFLFLRLLARPSSGEVAGSLRLRGPYPASPEAIVGLYFALRSDAMDPRLSARNGGFRVETTKGGAASLGLELSAARVGARGSANLGYRGWGRLRLGGLDYLLIIGKEDRLFLLRPWRFPLRLAQMGGDAQLYSQNDARVLDNESLRLVLSEESRRRVAACVAALGPVRA